jgi:hypothetical protein
MRAVDEIPTEPWSEPDVPPCRPKDVHYNAFPAQARARAHCIFALNDVLQVQMTLQHCLTFALKLMNHHK